MVTHKVHGDGQVISGARRPTKKGLCVVYLEKKIRTRRENEEDRGREALTSSREDGVN